MLINILELGIYADESLFIYFFFPHCSDNLVVSLYQFVLYNFTNRVYMHYLFSLGLVNSALSVFTAFISK